MRSIACFTAVALALLAGCAAGPDFKRPAAPESQGYSSAPLPAATASAPGPTGGAQRFAVARDIQADWWTVFRVPALNALIERAFEANPTLESARAALRAAQENVYAQRGFFFPSVQASYSPQRSKVAGNLGSNAPGEQSDGSVIAPASPGAPVIYSFHTAQLTVGYTPDVFGLQRRQVESLQAQAESQRYELEAAYVTLASNLVAAAVQDASLRRQIALTRAAVDANVSALELVERQLKSGYASRLDVALQENALAQARLQLPPLQRQFEQNRDLMRVLLGAAQDTELPAFELEAFQLPEELPLSLPSQLVAQRPDVRSAEAQLHAATAQVGVARAARLPQFTIDASIGGAGARIAQMFSAGGQFFNLAGMLAAPLFDGGTLKHRERAAQELSRQAAAQYRATVLAAFQNVADTLHAIHADAQSLAIASQASASSATALELTRRQYGRGYLDRLALIAAEQSHRQALLAQAQAQASRLGNSAALFQALGGGWWQRPPRDGELAKASN